MGETKYIFVTGGVASSLGLDCTIDGELLSFMKKSDVYALFGNAIDNAIEAVDKINDE